MIVFSVIVGIKHSVANRGSKVFKEMRIKDFPVCFLSNETEERIEVDFIDKTYYLVLNGINNKYNFINVYNKYKNDQDNICEMFTLEKVAKELGIRYTRKSIFYKPSQDLYDCI